MQPARFARYIKDPSSMGPDAVKELSSLVEQFPYFQPAHLLLSVAARRWDAAVYERTLKKTAIVVSDRARLFELIMEAEQLTEKAPAVATTQAQSANAGEASVATQPESPVKTEPAPVGTKGAETPAAGTITQQVEKEVAKQVVAARIEKELLQADAVPEKPREQPQSAPASFGDWLAYLKKNNGQPYSEIEEEVKREKEKRGGRQAPSSADRRERNRSILDSIIEKNPGPIRAKDEKFFAPESKAKESLLDNEHLVTETLARIYALQGNTSKAIRAYQILSLKNPQKSAYFAGLIEKLRNNEKPE